MILAETSVSSPGSVLVSSVGHPGGGGGYSTQTGVQCSAQAQNLDPTWLRDLKTSEKGGLKDLKRVFDKY